jgi:FHS family L-fucose permease-like MFS transporter
MTGSKSLAFIAPLVCYLYVLWFSFAARGAKVHEIQEDVVAGH